MWHRMLRKYFWIHTDVTFVEAGDYSEWKQKLQKALYDYLHMVNIDKIPSSRNPWLGIVGEGEYGTTNIVFYYLYNITPPQSSA